jgi:glucose dehydrogenase
MMLIVGLRAPQAQLKRNTAGEWRNYAGDKASSKYSPLSQINKGNFKSLKIAWTWRSADEEVIKANPRLKTWVWESTPLMVGGALYGNTNVWTMMSADEALGYIYLPFGTPSNDYYGGQRPGNGLFGESLVCLDARSGKRVWHFQMAHHGVWDYDLPAAPNLIDIKVNGKSIKAVAQMSKQGFCYVFDRVTGKPVWPIEEKPVPQSTAPGEKLSPTQPFPTKPAPVDRRGMTKDDVIDFTPELRKEALAILEKYNYGPLYTPPSLQKPTILMPGVSGGANWAGAAVDPETGILYVPSVTLILLANSPNKELMRFIRWNLKSLRSRD